MGILLAQQKLEAFALESELDSRVVAQQLGGLAPDKDARLCMRSIFVTRPLFTTGSA